MPGDVWAVSRRMHPAIRASRQGSPSFATSNDKAVEALGCGLRSSDTLLVSLGTYTASMTTAGSAT